MEPEQQAGNNRLAEAEQWQAVLERDTHFDGVFVYGVRSTGIYCRPSCASRKPAPQQVVFFAVPELAERAGFRPCQRCQPHQSPAADPQVEMVREACRLLRESANTPLTLDQLGRQVGSSPHHLQRVFKKVMGISPRQYADTCRVGKLKANLKDGNSVTEALYDAGYGSSSRLYEQASQQLGMTPANYQRGGPGRQIAYTIAESPLGLLLVAATQRGVCAVSLGDDAGALLDTLKQDYPAAEIRQDDAALGKWVRAMLEHLSGRLPHPGIPLDIRATAFQRLVWDELRRIPYGETRSYSEIAQAIGQPKAARAVAHACSQNPAAVVIPCHRVVRQGGDLGGYRWGIGRKEALIAQEREGAGGR
jgi:AraC family transcriptional regulator of adaptative response/methylated-DNA-[protein]-cysteine methyltransferase